MGDEINAADGSKLKAKSKFDLKSLRVSQDLEPATRPAFGHVHVGKPSKRCFFRTFLIPERSERFWLVEDLERELYLATPKLALELGSDAYPVCLMPFVTRDPSVGLQTLAGFKALDCSRYCVCLGNWSDCRNSGYSCSPCVRARYEVRRVEP